MGKETVCVFTPLMHMHDTEPLVRVSYSLLWHVKHHDAALAR